MNKTPTHPQEAAQKAAQEQARVLSEALPHMQR